MSERRRREMAALVGGTKAAVGRPKIPGLCRLPSTRTVCATLFRAGANTAVISKTTSRISLNPNSPFQARSARSSIPEPKLFLCIRPPHYCLNGQPRIHWEVLRSLHSVSLNPSHQAKGREDTAGCTYNGLLGYEQNLEGPTNASDEQVSGWSSSRTFAAGLDSGGARPRRSSGGRRVRPAEPRGAGREGAGCLHQ